MTSEARGRAEAAIVALLEKRSPGATICPSEAARELDAESFRDLMPEVRDAARRLVAAGRIEVTQKGRVIDLDHARGPIRLRLAPSGD
jgi:hypothetical protein